MPDELEQVEQSLYFEILKSEQKRVKLLLGFFSIAFVVWLLIRLFLAENLNKIVGGYSPTGYFLALISFGILYESAFLRVLIHFYNKRKHFHEMGRAGNTLIETIYPTAILYILCHTLNPLVALHSPVVLLYFLLIILSIFRLNLYLALFTGFSAATQFFLMNLFFLPDHPAPGLETYLSALAPAAGKSLFLFFGGLVAGAVGHEIHSRLRSSLQTLEDRNRVLGMFGQYVSPAVVDRLMSQKSGFESEIRHVCVMFLDIRDFTSFSEKRRPEEIISYLNQLFEFMIEIVNRHNGFVNKFLGDGFMAIFGAPISDGRDVQNAVNAAIELTAKVREQNDNGSIHPTKIGIGLHAGSAVTGNVGSSERKEYTIIGDTVNLASRIEQLNKQFSSTILITEDVFKNLESSKAERMESIQVKGREEPVVVYRLM